MADRIIARKEALGHYIQHEDDATVKAYHVSRRMCVSPMISPEVCKEVGRKEEEEVEDTLSMSFNGKMEAGGEAPHRTGLCVSARPQRSSWPASSQTQCRSPVGGLSGPHSQSLLQRRQASRLRRQRRRQGTDRAFCNLGPRCLTSKRTPAALWRGLPRCS